MCCVLNDLLVVFFLFGLLSSSLFVCLSVLCAPLTRFHSLPLSPILFSSSSSLPRSNTFIYVLIHDPFIDSFVNLSLCIF
jgi:hypothetical protein